MHFFSFRMVLITASYTMLWTSVHSSSGTLSIRSNALNIHQFHSIIVRDFIYVIFEWPSGFPYFLPLKSEFCNKEFMIWATVSSRSCFCWLYKASPSLTTKNIINLILALMIFVLMILIWWCPWVVISCAVGRGCLLWPMCSLGKTVSLCPVFFFCTLSPNMPVTSCISWLPTSAF